MNTDWNDLIQRYIAGHTNEEETRRLETAMKADDTLADLYLRHMELDVALEASAASAEVTRELLTAPIAPETRHGFAWLCWSSLTAAAAGIVFGMFCTSMALGFGSPGHLPHVKRLFPLKNGDFEESMGTLPSNPPASFGMWTGDTSDVVAGSAEASPNSGSRMLRFTRAEVDPPTSRGVPVRCDLYQLIDLRQIWEQVAADDEVTLEVRASFLDTDTRPEGSGTFRCRLLINPKSPDIVRAGWPESRSDGCAYARTDLENGPATRGQWRTAQAKVILPRSARVAAVHLGVIRFTDVKQPGAEFGHCYVDDVSLTITARSLPQKE